MTTDVESDEDVITWEKVSVPEGSKRKPQPFLEVRRGKRRTSYRVNYRQDGLKLREVLGSFDDWREAERAAEAIIGKAKYGEKPKEKSLVRTDELLDELVRLREDPSVAAATLEQIEIFSRVHMKPFLNGECAYLEPEKGLVTCPHASYLESGKCEYAAELKPHVYLNYKAHFRAHNPKGALFNHWKYFTMLFKYAFEKGLLERPFKLAFDEQKEDFRKVGQVIADDLLETFLECANRTWRDRALLGRLEGQRPGLYRKLRKAQVNLETGIVKVDKEDSKNRRAYDFVLTAPSIQILKSRLELEYVKDSPYFFPSEADHSKPMDKHLKGWHSAWKRARELIEAAAAELESQGDLVGAAKERQLAAGIKLAEDGFTPHDLRHTYLTIEFKVSKNVALICYSRDLSLEEAQDTYLHFTAEDTRKVAEESVSAAIVAQMLKGAT